MKRTRPFIATAFLFIGLSSEANESFPIQYLPPGVISKILSTGHPSDWANARLVSRGLLDQMNKPQFVQTHAGVNISRLVSVLEDKNLDLQARIEKRSAAHFLSQLRFIDSYNLERLAVQLEKIEMYAIHKKYIFKSIKNIVISDPELLVRFASKIDPRYHHGTRAEVEDYEAMVSRSIRSLVLDNPDGFKSISDRLPRFKYLAPILKEAMLDRNDPAEVDSLLKIGFPVYFGDFSISTENDIEIQGYNGVIDWAIKNSHYQVLETHLQNYRLRYEQLLQEDILDEEKARMIFDDGAVQGVGHVEFTRDRFVPFRLAFQEKNLNAMRLFVRYAPDEVLVMYFTKLLPEIKKSTDNEKFFSDLFRDQALKDKAKQVYESLKANPPTYLVGRVQVSYLAKIGLIYLGKFFD